MKSVPGEVAVVTGAASGIGRAAALRLAREGWAVAAVDVDAAGLDALAAETSGVLPYVCDVTDQEAVAAVVRDVGRELGPPRRLVHCAAVAAMGRLLDQAPADTLRLMNVLYGGTLHTVQAVVPAMAARGGGEIVLLGSIGGWVPVPLGGGYGAAKAAVHFLAEIVAAEHRAEGIRVLCVCPPAVETPMLARIRRESPELLGPITGLSPEKVLDSMDRALSRGRAWAFPGRGTRALWTARRLAPRALSGIIGRTLVGK
ncbi:SDR family NAD(P)-dependent oxidoreductase [Kitasatospora brasiliensis]|uniref:SDR family NAD(P)-dependent oxidoreductase n=1 Tax=Kitasatospora brasiliensis TaxID=3058040 RepID=UPI0029319FA4|nr:SDR family oxidoreductase [Kitasatospora sp. K002]